MKLLQEEQHLLVTHRLVTADIIRPLNIGQLMQLNFSAGVAWTLQRAFSGMFSTLIQQTSVSTGCKQPLCILFDWLLSCLVCGWQRLDVKGLL